MVVTLPQKRRKYFSFLVDFPLTASAPVAVFFFVDVG